MLDAISSLFDSESFMPHGHCFLWEPLILWLHVASDAVIGVSYFSIPLAILLFARKRKDIPFRHIFLLFGAFIVLCGSTHFMSIWVLWKPDYGPEGILKAVTALVSALTAVVTWRVIPLALTLPSPTELQEMNFRLKETNVKIEQEVAARTAELKEANIKLQSSEKRLQYIARQNEQQFRMLVDGVTDYAIYMLDPRGLIVNWNAGAQRIKGYEASEIIGQHFSKFYTEDDRKAGLPEKSLATAIAEGKYESEGWHIRKSGEQFRAHVVIDPIYDEARQVVGYAKVTRDITEQHIASETLEKTKEQLYQAQKMEMVGHLTGGVAHDFNNLLQTIIGGLALVAKLVNDAKVQLLIGTAQKAAARGAKLTRQLLAFSRQQALRPETLDINQVIGNFETLLRQAGGYGVQVHFDFGLTLWFTEIDATQFQSGLLNLIINARDAMPSGGSVTIQTRNVTLNKAQAEALKDIEPGAYVMVSVSDTGQGMATDIISHAIEPFFTTKDVGKGSGLGLSQVYGFVRQSNGQMEIKSEVGLGTTIKLYLPKSSTTVALTSVPTDFIKSAAPAAAEITLEPKQTKIGTVLVVEDDPLVLMITVEAVKSLGYDVYSAPDAHKALTWLEKGIDIDVLFTDIVMPGGMNGIELAREVIKRKPHTKVLMVSGYSKEILAAKEGTENMALISKPYELADLALEFKKLKASDK